MAEQAFLSYEHSVEGSITLGVTGVAVRFTCNWPFDRSRDEWIYVSNEFARDEYVRGIRRLLEGHRARIQGTRSGYIAFQVLSAHEVRMEVEDQAANSPTSFSWVLKIEPAQLLPDVEPRTVVET